MWAAKKHDGAGGFQVQYLPKGFQMHGGGYTEGNRQDLHLDVDLPIALFHGPPKDIVGPL
jgi:hypothetical protein